MSRVKSTRRRRSSERRALSLVEAVVSITIVGVTLVAALNTLGASRLALRSTGDRARARLLAHGLMSEILRQNYADPEYAVGSFGLGGDEVGDGSRALWEDVDDYDGWSASPPERKDGTVIDGFDGWERSVSVAWVNPADLSQAVGFETGVKRITVEVTRNKAVVASLTAVRTSGGGASGGKIIVFEKL